MDSFRAYHGVDAAHHQSQFDELSSQGWVLDALDVSGDPAAAVYAAVWVPSDGRGWAALHGLDSGGYQQRFDELTAQGLLPSLLSATGSADRAVFAASFEQRDVGAWFARHGLVWGSADSPGTLVSEMARARQEGFVPRSLVAYGDPADRRFAGIWWQNRDVVDWSWWLADEGTYQSIFDALVTGGLRPTTLSVADDHAILASFRDDTVGAWSARHGVPAADYQAAFDAALASGQRPLVVSAGGTGDVHYAAVFAETSTVVPRRWTAVGLPGLVSPVDGALDDVVRPVQQSLGVHGASLAVARAGTLVTARGYTWAEEAVPVVTPATTFRLASVSKFFAAAAAQTLVDDGVIALDAPVFPAGVVALPAGATVDPRIARVTVGDVLIRRSGLQRDLSWRDVSVAAGRTGPPTPDEVVRFVAGQAMACDPGLDPDSAPTEVEERAGYSNVAFMVLGAFVERVTGGPLDSYLRQRLLAPLRVADLYVAATTGSVPGEVDRYHAAGASPSLLDLTGPWAGDAYGGTFVLEPGPAAGGLATSATTTARLLGTHAAWDTGGRTPGTRYGDFEGTSTIAHSRSDDLDWALFLNHRISNEAKNALVTAVDTALDAL